ncbi:MAG: T9SS type A sorting domain-containing protein [Candidatus Coatesbacteria bacterium]|nr:MAG: T9SS type A sorting domain-containing protein [Candidatus Coatesbacteria bacterium]
MATHDNSFYFTVLIVAFVAVTLTSAEEDYLDATRVLLHYNREYPDVLEYGLYQVQRADGEVEEDYIQGRHCVHLKPDSLYMYFDVDETYIPYTIDDVDYNCNDVFVTVIVNNQNDVGEDLYVKLEYDAPGPGGDFLPTERMFEVSTRDVYDPDFPLESRWRKLTFCLPLVEFQNGQYGVADFRLVPTPAAPGADIEELYVMSVSVSRCMGGYTSPIYDDFAAEIESFEDEEMLICSVLIYWYNVNTGWHITEDGCAMSTHPSLRGAPYIIQVEGCTEYLFPSDFSYKEVGYWKRELQYMEDAGIDIAMIDYWGFTKDQFIDQSPEDPDGFQIGLRNIVIAREELVSENKNPPKLCLLYDTPAVRIERALKIREAPLNVSGEFSAGPYTQTEVDSQIFAKYVRDYFSIVPPSHWAAVDGEPIVFIFKPGPDTLPNVVGCEPSFFPFLEDKFAYNFDDIEPYLIMSSGWYESFFEEQQEIYWDETFVWCYGLPRPTVFCYGPGEPGQPKAKEPGKVAEFTPGFDARGFGYPGDPYFPREHGNAFARNWYRAIKQSRGSRFFVAETWNLHFKEGTSVSPSQEFESDPASGYSGDDDLLYMYINEKYVNRLKKGVKYVVCAPHFNSGDLLNYDIDTWIEAPYDLRVYDPVTKNIVWEVEDLFYPPSKSTPVTNDTVYHDRTDAILPADSNLPSTDVRRDIRCIGSVKSREEIATEFGMNLCCGDFNGDGFDDIAVAMGPAPNIATQHWLKVLDLGNPTPKCEIWTPFGNLTHGLNIAAGDIDGDGVDEIVVTPGPTDQDDSGLITAYDFPVFHDPYNNWDPVQIIDPPYDIEDDWPGSETVNGGLNVACGDADCKTIDEYEDPFPDYDIEMNNDEIVVAPGFGSTLNRYVRFYYYDPFTDELKEHDLGNIPIFSDTGGMRVDCADILKDDQFNVGKEEVICGEYPEYRSYPDNNDPIIRAWTWGIPGGYECRWEKEVDYGGSDCPYGVNVSAIDYRGNGYYEVLYGNTWSALGPLLYPVGCSEMSMCDPLDNISPPWEWTIDPVYYPRLPVNVAAGVFNGSIILDLRGDVIEEVKRRLDKPLDTPHISKPAPNPVTGGEIRFDYSNPGHEAVELTIYDIKGRKVYSNTLDKPGETGSFVVNFAENGISLTPGVYIFCCDIGITRNTGRFVYLR